MRTIQRLPRSLLAISSFLAFAWLPVQAVAQRPATRLFYAELAEPMLASPNKPVTAISDEDREFLARAAADTRKSLGTAEQQIKRQEQFIARLQSARIGGRGGFASQAIKDATIERETNKLDGMKERLHAMRTGDMVLPPFSAPEPSADEICRLPPSSNRVSIADVISETACEIRLPKLPGMVVILKGIDASGLRAGDELILDLPLRVNKPYRLYRLSGDVAMVLEAFDAHELTPMWKAYQREREQAAKRGS